MDKTLIRVLSSGSDAVKVDIVETPVPPLKERHSGEPLVGMKRFGCMLSH